MQFSVYGQWSSVKSEFFFVEILKCSFVAENPEEECEQDPQVLQSVVERVSMLFYFKNKFFDHEELDENPVKSYLEFQFYGFPNEINVN